MADVVFRSARVLDGTGAESYPADVAVTGTAVTGIHTRPGEAPSARRTIEADGRVLAPGFIDMHAHSDLQILVNPDHTAKVSQGVTTEVVGQDGISFAPCDDAARAVLRRQVAGWNGEPDDFDFDWDSVAGYLDRLDRGIACNAAYLVPQGTVRMMVVGPDDRPATAEEIERMCALVERGMAEGAVGLSSGLTYTPGMFADDAELARLCAVAGRMGGYYSPHHRSYGAGALDAYAEMVRVCRDAACPLHLTHATLNFPPNRGRGEELLAIVDDALAGGLDVTLDTYPYLSGATSLVALMPSWAATGGPDALLGRIAQPQTRERIAHELDHVGTDGCHGCTVDWDTIEISGVRNPELRSTVGRTVAELAEESGRSAAEEYFDLLVRDDLATTILQHVGDEHNVRTIMRHPRHCGGSDAILVGDRPHPRAWGTFPRYLGHYARDEEVLSLADCIHHLTGRPARRLGLVDRGLVREGYAADLVLFDPDTVHDTATYAEPVSQAEGIDQVMVGGRFVIDGAQRTDVLPGRALRRTDGGTRPVDRR